MRKSGDSRGITNQYQSITGLIGNGAWNVGKGQLHVETGKPPKETIIHFYPKIIRMHGAPKWLFLFATKLQDRGFENIVVTVDVQIQLPYWFTAKVITFFWGQKPVREYGGISKICAIIHNLAYIFFLPFLIRKQPHVRALVFHSELSLFAIIFSRFLFPKSQFVYYCYQPPRELYDLKPITKGNLGLLYWLLLPFFELYKLLDKSLVKSADGVLVWSDLYMENVKSIYGKHNYLSVPAGVDYSVFDKKAIGEQKISNFKQLPRFRGKRILCTLSALTKKKNLPFFIQTVKELSDKRGDVHGVIVGEGPEYVYLRKLIADLRMEDVITLTGYVSQEDLPLYLHLADIVYYTELNGSWTMSSVEAGAAAKPVIVAPGGSMRTLVVDGKTGYILDGIDTTEEIVRKTEYLLNNATARESMGRENYIHSKQFAVDESIDKFLEFITHC